MPCLPVLQHALKVAGDRAALAGSLTASSLPGPTHFLIVVEDNGSGSGATADGLTAAFDDEPFACAEELDRVTQPITGGDIVVR